MLSEYGMGGGEVGFHKPHPVYWRIKARTEEEMVVMCIRGSTAPSPWRLEKRLTNSLSPVGNHSLLTHNCSIYYVEEDGDIPPYSQTFHRGMVFW